jgi:hypothetical protein
MSESALSALLPAVREDLLRGIAYSIPTTFAAGTKLYRFSSSHLFGEGFYVSPWWFKHEDFLHVFDTVRRDPEYLSARARGQATIPMVWNGADTANLLDCVAEAVLKVQTLFFRGPGRDQRRGTKILRAPKGAMQNFLPALSWKNDPKPNLMTARSVLEGMRVTPIDQFSM